MQRYRNDSQYTQNQISEYQNCHSGYYYGESRVAFGETYCKKRILDYQNHRYTTNTQSDRRKGIWTK